MDLYHTNSIFTDWLIDWQSDWLVLSWYSIVGLLYYSIVLCEAFKTYMDLHYTTTILIDWLIDRVMD